MYTNLDNDVLGLGPVDDYDKLQEEEGSHIYVKQQFVGLTDHSGETYLLGVKDKRLYKLTNGGTVPDSDIIAGFTQFERAGDIFLFKNRVLAFSMVSFTYHVPVKAGVPDVDRVGLGIHQNVFVFGTPVRVLIPGTGKIYQPTKQTPSKRVFCTDYPDPDEVDIADLVKSPKVGKSSIFDHMWLPDIEPSDTTLFEPYEQLSLKVSETLILSRGATFAYPLKLEPYLSDLDSIDTSEITQNRFNNCLNRPLLRISNTAELYVQDLVFLEPGMPPPAFPGPSLMSELGYMAAITAWNPINPVGRVYLFHPGFAFTDVLFTNPGQQETQLASAHVCFLGFGSTYTDPFVALTIRPNYGTCTLVVTHDQYDDRHVLYPFKRNPSFYSPPSDESIFYSSCAMQEEYMIFEGNCVAKVYFYDFFRYPQSGDLLQYYRARKTDVLLTTFSGKLYSRFIDNDLCKDQRAAAENDTKPWDGADLTVWDWRPAELCRKRYEMKCPSKVTYAPHDVIICASPNDPPVHIHHDDNNFLFSLSSTESLSAIDQLLLQHLRTCLSTGEWSEMTVAHTVYVLAVIIPDVPENVRTTPYSPGWFSDGNGPGRVKEDANRYNPARQVVYTYYHQDARDYYLDLFRYTMTFRVPQPVNFYQTVNMMQRSGFQRGDSVKITGSLISQEGAEITVGDDTVHLGVCGVVELTATKPELIHSEPIHGIPAFSKLYKLDDSHLLTYTSTDAVVFNFTEQGLKVDKYPLGLSTGIRAVADMSLFAEFVQGLLK